MHVQFHTHNSQFYGMSNNLLETGILMKPNFSSLYPTHISCLLQEKIPLMGEVSLTVK